MADSQSRWFNLELDRVTQYPFIELRAWFASTPLPKANKKGNNNTMCMPVPISRSTYALLLRADQNHWVVGINVFGMAIKRNSTSIRAFPKLVIDRGDVSGSWKGFSYKLFIYLYRVHCQFSVTLNKFDVCRLPQILS